MYSQTRYYSKPQKPVTSYSNNATNYLISDSPLSHQQNYQSTKENCLGLSNQSESLLVSSLRASSQHNQGSSVKRQKRLNSDFLLSHTNNERNKILESANSTTTFGKQQHNITITECIGQDSFAKLLPSDSKVSSNTPCTSCTKQLPELKEKLQKNTHKLQELQALIKICFSKNLSCENLLTEKNQQILQINTRQDDLERVVKKTEQVLVKQSVSKTVESDEVKASLSKLTEKITEKTKELNEIIELQKGILQQKISKISTFYEQKFDSLISMVQQLAKTQQQHQKYLPSQRDSTLSKIDFESSQQILPLKQCYMLPTQPKRMPSSDKTRNQSKSKISYYLSKSNFNDTTTLGDTSINHLSAIGGQ